MNALVGFIPNTSVNSPFYISVRETDRKTSNTISHLLGVYHCQGTAKVAGLRLLRQLVPSPFQRSTDCLEQDTVNDGSG